jgi:hypothetical protein
MATYLIKQEQGLPLLRQVALSLAATMQTDVLSIDPTVYSSGTETIHILCDAIRSSFSPVVVESLVSGDVVIFEMPPYLTDQVTWTGLALYRQAINATLNAEEATSNTNIFVIPLACLPWS